MKNNYYKIFEINNGRFLTSFIRYADTCGNIKCRDKNYYIEGSRESAFGEFWDHCTLLRAERRRLMQENPNADIYQIPQHFLLEFNLNSGYNVIAAEKTQGSLIWLLEI